MDDRSRQALCNEWFHVAFRIVWFGMLAFCGVAVVRGVRDSLPRGFVQPALWVGAYSLAWLVIQRTCLVTRRIYGTAAGIEVRRWGTRPRIVPWEEVEAPAYAWWSINPVLPRVATFAVKHGGRPIRFYANEGALERFRTAKLLATRSRDGREGAKETS